MIQSLNSKIRRLPAWPIYIVSVAWFSWLFWQAVSGNMGPDPVNALEHALGDIALQLMVVVLAITPLRKFLGVNLLKFRRALGLAVFFFVAMHLAVWMFLDVQLLGQVLSDLVKRPYITVGMAAFLLMVPLAITSNNWSIRKMGAQAWNKLHKLTYAAVILGAVHNVMIQKVWETEPLVYLGVIAALLAMRIKWQRRVAAA